MGCYFGKASNFGINNCSKMINKALPGTIDERVLNMSPETAEEVMENINLCINSARAIGCNIGDLTLEDIITADVRLIMAGPS